MRPTELLSECKSTLGGEEIDTLDLGRETYFILFRMPAEAWIRDSPSLNELHSIPSCSQSSLQQKNIHPKKPSGVRRVRGAGKTLSYTSAEALM